VTAVSVGEFPGSIAWSLAGLDFALNPHDEIIATEAARIFDFWPTRQPNSNENRESLTFSTRPTDKGIEVSTSRSGQCYIRPDAPSAVQVIEALAMGAILAASSSVTTVHGALLARRGKSILIAGPSYSGKSTLACALWGSGFSLLCDDVTMLQCTEATAAPVPRRVSVRHPSREMLGDQLWENILSARSCTPAEEGYLFHPAEIDNQWSARELPLGAIVFLNRLGAPTLAPATLNPLLPAKALLSLAPYTNVIREQGLGDALKRLELLINAVPSYDMARGALSQMVIELTSLADNAHV
jgi:hypothetical protein